MDDNRDLDLAIAVALAESNEKVSDDDLGFNQQLAFNACRIPKMQQQPKRKPDKKKDLKGNSLVEDARSGDEGPQRKVRKQATKREIIPRMNVVVDDCVERTSSRSMAELDSFRYTRGGLRGAHALSEAVPVKEHPLKPVEAFLVKSNCQTEISNTDQLGADSVFADNVDFAADPAECLVIDIDTDEVVELCDETQFSVLLRLCGEECEQDEVRAEVPDVDTVPSGTDGTRVNSLSIVDEPTTFEVKRGGLPGHVSVQGHESTDMDIVLTRSEGSTPIRLIAESASAPSTNAHYADLQVFQEGTGDEKQSSQDQFCDDVISSMMTQKCVSGSEVVKTLHGISPSPLKNIPNLPARVETSKLGVKMKSVTPAANRVDSQGTKSGDVLDKKEANQIRRPVLQVVQLRDSSEELCQNKQNRGDLPCDIIAVEHLSISESVVEDSPVREGHKRELEDVLLYREEVDIVLTRFEGSTPIRLIAESASAPSTNAHYADLQVFQEGTGVEKQSSQDQFCDDVISSMMTQKCVSESEVVKTLHGIPPSPLKNISNLPARVETSKLGVKMKSLTPAANRVDSEGTNNKDVLDKKEAKQIRRPVLQVVQLGDSSEELCQNKQNTGDLPCDIIAVEHLSISESVVEDSPVREGHKRELEDVLLYREEVDIVLTRFEGSTPIRLIAESASAPSTNAHYADLQVFQEGTGVEKQSSQDQFCDDVISSMMTQKCVSESEVVKTLHGIPPSPLKNISNLPARVETSKQGVKMKSVAPASNKVDSEGTNSEEFLDKKGAKQIRRPVLQVVQLGDSSEELCQNKQNTGDLPCDIIAVEHLSISESVVEDSPVRDGHASELEDVLLYREEVRETIQCPLCGENISGISVEERLAHTNSCLDKLDTVQEGCPQEEGYGPSHVHASDEVKDWLDKLNLSRYVSLFAEQEIDWDTLPWLTEEDLVVMGITAIGPRRKMFLAIQELKCGSSGGRTEPQNVQAAPSSGLVNASTIQIPLRPADGICRIPQADGVESNNLITNYFPLPPESGRKKFHEKPSTNIVQHTGVVKNKTSNRPRSSVYKNTSGIPAWMCIPGTPFRVDAFQHLSGDCSYWFLTHFHTDHYQGLTRGFRYGHIFCSSITARLVNLRIGVSWEKLMIIPLHEKVKIAGVDVTFIDANHCPGSVMILFEPPNGEAVLHTGDFRFCAEMANDSLLQATKIRTLVLDTTYCDPQYDFPTQDTVIRFVIEAIQAEMFNSDTLFLIGTYTIGKERIFLEVGKVLKKYVYVGAPKKRLLDCMDLSADDTKWLTCNEHESFIHVVSLWSISSFKRMSSIARHYQNRYKLIVAFSPTGWSFGRGKKKTPGKRWKKGTMIRYEVPYSEHCSFPELREFLRFIAPDDIIPSVPGKDGVGADAMIASLWSEDQ